MGCCAAVPALRAAQAIVLADPAARVLVVNVELCTLHLQETTNLEVALSFLLFGDGAAAALVTAEPEGLCLGDFVSALIPDTAAHITWHIGDQGFLMHLSGQVPGAILRALRDSPQAVLRGEAADNIDLWAVHGGGRTVLDAVQAGLSLEAAALAPSRAVLAAQGQYVFRHGDVRAGRDAANRHAGADGPCHGVWPGHGRGDVPLHHGMMEFASRAVLAEAMDEPGLDEAVYQRCLADLAMVNRVTLTHLPTLRWLARATKSWPSGARIAVLDVGYGQGDLLRAIAAWAAKARFVADLSGIDRTRAPPPPRGR